VRAAEREWSFPAAWVFGVQNGMHKDEVLGAAFGASRLIGAATILGAQHAADGSIVITGPGPTYLGELDPLAGGVTANAVAILTEAGMLVWCCGRRRATLPVYLTFACWHAAADFG
jgi:ketopantoate reductase